VPIRIRSKNSVVKDKAPLPADLEIGELALNAHQDSPAIYLKDAAGAIRKVAGDATTTAKGIVQLADATAVTAGTAGMVVDAKELKDSQVFLQDGTNAKPRTVNAKLKDAVSVKDFGAKGDGSVDDTAAIQAAIDAHGSVFIPEGVYRCDGSIIIQSTYAKPKSVMMTAATRLVRRAASSTSQAPVVELIGDYGHFDGGFGEIESENDSPRGVVVLGQRDTNALSTGNSLFWSFVNCDVRCKDYPTTAPVEGATIGVLIPSAQPFKGSNFANYFGTVSNVRVYGASISFKLTDIVNAHTFTNCCVENFWHYAWKLNGAYGNTIYGGFIHGCRRDGGYGIYLGNKQDPTAPNAASHQSSNNSIFGVAMELYTNNNHGVYIPAGVGGYESAHNFIQISWNSSGAPVEDFTTTQTNSVFDGATTFRLGENLRMPDTDVAGRHLLQVGTTSFTANHAIARSGAPGGIVLAVENLSTTAESVGCIQCVLNTPAIGYNTAVIGIYHKRTAAFRFKVLDSGDCHNVNNVYAAISDRKLKDVIGDASSQWNDVKFLAGHMRRYTLKADPSKAPQIGWIAQEIEDQCPGLVFDTPDMEEKETIDGNGEKVVTHEPTGTTTKGVRYSIAMLKAFKALGEAMQRIEDLEARLAALEPVPHKQSDPGAK
jgi:hypothetical protein